ncbi:protein unc-45 homolog B-like [Homarus americanus]|uniref:protein unc-45 homolog B-like n=1 Tax=Homarus americanus TaxID=6706 RepID=UPI001C4673CB|nr:protein unc-45 homolog B-like [Homarus americanus]XP_042221332.1 protein unc-45 homolog B-like [Homarus americanus]XP_042221333.1 protein unc-45 homolog B-like [Homarus americanus]
MTKGEGDKTPQQLKEEGNEAYKLADWDKAIDKYSQALTATTEDKERSVFYKNRAAVYLKIEDYENVVKDCTQCLEISPKDPKALFRRAQAYEALEQAEKAYADARTLQVVDPKNKEVQEMLSRVHKVVQDLVEEKTKTSGKVQQLFDILFDPGCEKDKRETCANNLVALARERAGSELLMKQNILGRMVQMLKTEKNFEIKIACARTLSEFCKDLDRTKLILQEIGIPWLLDLMNNKHEGLVNATQYTFQKIFNTLSGMDIKLERKPDKILLAQNQKEIDSLMATLVSIVTQRTMSGLCRDAVIELILKNVDWEKLNWADKFIRMGGIEKMLDICSELEEFQFESRIDITDNTRMTTAICLAKVYDSQYDDKAREAYRNRVDEYIRLRLLTPDLEHKVRVAVAISTLLLGPLDVGSHLIAREGILEMLLVMANSDDLLQQKAACEALIAAATKKDKCRSIITQGTDILKKLYQSKNDAIKVRALVGLCKLGSMGGTDASMKPFSEGASLKLAEACRRFLVNPTKDKDMRRWACEGLSYLTLDADVKEKLISDRPALRSMIELAKSGDMNCLYGVVATFVNLCNAYDTQEVIPEMVELAKFAKQHVPETHDLDDQDFVDKRVTILAEEGAATALTALSKTDSQNSRELIARLFNAICQMQDNRGLVVQQGGTKALLDLATEGTKKGKTVAAQALARIAITINPEVAFPGQRAYEVVRPLLKLLDPECQALENFESLMGLTNIAGISESTRKRIIKERGLPLIENYMFEHHEMIRRAAIQCMANMCASPDIIKLLEGKNDKFKYLFLCASDEDEEIIKAAAGALCMVMSESPKCLVKVFEAKDWEEILEFLLSHANKDIQYRGTVIVFLLVSHDKQTAERIIDTHCKTALEAISKIDNPEFVLPKAREYAHNTLKLCATQWKLIKDPDAVD